MTTTRLEPNERKAVGNPSERDIHIKMIATLCNGVSALRLTLLRQNGLAAEPIDPAVIEAEVREIAERELREKA